MSLKAAAHNVLERNTPRNRCATSPKNERNFGPISGIEKGQKLRTEIGWEDDVLVIIEWLRNPDPPAEPFRLDQVVSVSDPPLFWRTIKGDIAAGPTGPRARYGAIQDDLRRLSALFGGPVQ